MNDALLDTHYWIWLALSDTKKLDAAAQAELSSLERGRRLLISDVSVWEMARLVADGDLDFGVSVDTIVAEILARGSVTLLPLSTRVPIESTRLPGTIHRDPADRFLVATAREHGLTLITRDKPLLAYGKQGHVLVRRI